MKGSHEEVMGLEKLVADQFYSTDTWSFLPPHIMLKINEAIKKFRYLEIHDKVFALKMPSSCTLYPPLWLKGVPSVK